MSGFRQQVALGAWLTADRVRLYSLMLLTLSSLAVAGWIALSHDYIDLNGKPLGTDFSSFYAAGSLVLEGRPGAVYDGAAHYAREQRIFGTDTPYYAWLYPPIFLLVATPLALLPYPLALAVWQGGSIAAFLWVIGAILRPARRRVAVARLWLPAAAAFPAVFINLGHGQNGLLSAALLGAALLALPNRPVTAGVLFALLAYKPQFALVIPLALLAAAQWRALAAAAFAVIVLSAVTCLAFGPELWLGFAASTEISRKVLLEQGDVGFEKLQSIFAAVRMWGGGVALAYLAQGAVSAAVMGCVGWTWHVCGDRNIRAAALLVAALLASPHVLDYDLAILGPAIAFAISAGVVAGFRNYEISLLAAAWIVPLIARSVAGTIALPLGVLVLLALFTVLMRRVIAGRKATAAPQQIATA